MKRSTMGLPLALPGYFPETKSEIIYFFRLFFVVAKR